jgi:hypothetical protein
MQVPCAHFFLTNPTNTPPRQHRLGKTFSTKNLSGSDSDTTYPDFFFYKELQPSALHFPTHVDSTAVCSLVSTNPSQGIYGGL